MSRDDIGLWPKYSPPTVVNGRVYMASFSGYVSVFGLLPKTPDFNLVAPASRVVKPGKSATYTVSNQRKFGYTGSVTLSVSGLPAGATATFAVNPIATSGATTLKITTTVGTPLGLYSLTVTGVSGALTHSVATTLLVSNVTPGKGAVSVDFIGRDVPMANAEVAGVVAKSNWNNASGASGTNLVLRDETNAATTATLTWAAGTVWSLPVADNPGDFRIMNGYLDPVGQNATVTVPGLPVDANGYDVYVYSDGDNGGATRAGNYQISGAGFITTTITATDTGNANFSGAYAQANNSAGNYVQFTISATGFTLTAIPGTSSDSVPRAPVNGIQIVPR